MENFLDFVAVLVAAAGEVDQDDLVFGHRWGELDGLGNRTQMEIAVIGNSEFILGFRLAGIRKTYASENDEKLIENITSALQDDEVGILVLNSSDMEKVPRKLRETLENSVKPTVIAIGGEEGGLSMRERIKRSVGVDLWK